MTSKQTTGRGVTMTRKSAREGIEIKAVPFRVKAAEDDGETGVVTAVVSVFGNIDAYGDVMQPGSFKSTLAEHKDAGDVIPFMWSHESADPFAYIGELRKADETDEGLQVEAVFDLDNPTAVQVYKLLKGRRLREFSFGFIPRKTKAGELDGVEVREVHDVELLEVSVVHVGANRATRVIGVKAAPDGAEGEKTGPTIEQLKAAEDVLAGALDAIDAVRGTIAEKLGEVQAAVKSLDDTDPDKTDEEPDPDQGEGSRPAEERAAASDSTGRPEDRASGKGSPTSGVAAADASDAVISASALLAILDTEGVL